MHYTASPHAPKYIIPKYESMETTDLLENAGTDYLAALEVYGTPHRQDKKTRF